MFLIELYRKNYNKIIELKNLFKTLVATVFLIICISVSLLNSIFFYSAPSISYYGFCITVLLFTIVQFHNYHTNKQSATLKLPVLIFGLWCLYVVVHYFNNSSTILFTIYSISLYFFLIKAIVLFKIHNFNFKLFFVSIVAIASIESIYCITQFLGWFKSKNELFKVTGSWDNPNVTAIFLALSVPVFLFLFQGRYKKVVMSVFFTVLIALVLLKCRAAFIGTVLSIIIFYVLEYDFIDWVKNKKNRTTAKAIFILSLLIIIPICSHLYNAKKASADGRKFIWKVSTTMAIEKPFTGYGYGFFEKEYNLYQASYINKGKATTEELMNAGPVIMPHNELLLNAVEGGTIGLVLMVFFFASLLLTIKLSKKTDKNELNNEATTIIKNGAFNLSYAAIVGFIGMSMVNSTIQIVPIMCLLIIYAAIISSSLEPIQIPSSISFLETKIISILSKTAIIAISMYLLYLLFGIAAADRQNKKAKILKDEAHYTQALQMMPSLEFYLKQDSNYWQNYGLLYFKTQNFQEAIICFKKAQTLSSLPEIYIGAGKSYEKSHQYPQAITEYETLVILYPSKFLYRMILLDTYLKNKDKIKAIALAQEIINLKPKIPSEKVQHYKSLCMGLLNQLAPQTVQRKPFQSQSFKFK